MRGRTKLFSALLIAGFGLPAMAGTPENFTRGEMLAWHIEAYVPCQDGIGISDLKEEVHAFNATREEMLLALDLLELDETACYDLKKTSGKLLALAMNEPEKFDMTFDFGAEETETGEEEQAPARLDLDILKPKSLTPPPQAAALKTRSSY